MGRRPPVTVRPSPLRRPSAIAGLVLAAVLVLAVLTQASPLERMPAFARAQPLNIAHAGGQGIAPANTFEAFHRALDIGADVLEVDAQLTADGELVLHHDGTVDRQTDGSGDIAEMTVPELKQLDAGHTFEGEGPVDRFRGRGIEIPTLEEAFDAFPETPMIVEMKLEGGAGIVPALAELINRSDRRDNLVVASFELDYVRQFRALEPDVATNMPEDETRAFYIRQLVGLERWWRPPGAFFQVPERHEGRHVTTERFVAAADRLGVDVHVWTVNEVADMRRLVDLGVHGIITDYPDRLAEALAGAEGGDVLAADPEAHARGLGLVRWLQERATFLTPLLVAVTHLGDEEFYILVFPLLYWSVHRAVGLRVGVLLLLSAGLNSALKLAFRSPRPYFLDPEVGRLTEASFGIPSGHAQNGVAVWGLLAAEVGRRWAWAAALAVMFLLGLSRVHLGVHLPEDVLIGWAVGAVLLVGYLRLRAPVTAWLVARTPSHQALVAFLAAVGLIAVGAVLRVAIVGWEVPVAWVGAGDAALGEGARSLAGLVNVSAALFGLAAGVVLIRSAGGFDTAGGVAQRIARFLLGLAGVLVVWQGLGALLPTGEDPVALAFRFVRYGFLGLWIGGLAPLLFVRIGLAPAGPASTAAPAARSEDGHARSPAGHRPATASRLEEEHRHDHA